MEKRLLRLLIIDDSPDDAEISIDVLRRAGYMLKTQRVQDVAGMQSSLAKSQWDAVISEYNLAHFSAQMALDLLRQSGLDLPVILVARKIGDNEIVKLMRAGVHDVIFKHQTARLLPAIERELHAAADRDTQRATQRALKEMEDKHRALIGGSQEPVCYSHDGMHTDANPAYLALFGYDSLEELEGIPVLDLIDKADHARIKEYFRRPDTSKQAAQAREFTAVKKDGTRLPVEVAITSITLGDESCHQIIVNDISRRKAIESKLQFLNQHDPLTALYNRHYFLQELGKAVENAKAGGSSALLYIDLDQLSNINEALGHAAGDRLLLKLARLFREQVRETDLVARFGGDEFTVLMYDVDEAQARALAEGIVVALKGSPFSEGGKTYECNCTYSLTFIDATADSLQKVLTRAYTGYAEAKAQKFKQSAAPGERAPRVSPPAPAGTDEASGWAQRIQAALETNRFQLVYQPIVNLHAEVSESYEVLLRLRSETEDGVLIPATDFIPVAELTGQARAVDHWVVQQAIETLADLHRNGRSTSFFVNLSPMAVTDETLVPTIRERTLEAGLNPETLVFEINERCLADRPQESSDFIGALRAIGCRIAVDDFGGHYGAINHLRHQPVEYVKITGALIHKLTNDSINQAVVEGMTQLAKMLGKQTIAKFVEDAESLTLLYNYGVDYVQGHYFQAPDPALSYDFGGESVSSDHAVAGWTLSGR